MAMLLPSIGALMEGNAASAAKQGEAQGHDLNANVAEINAGMAYAQAGQNEEASRRGSRQSLGQQRAAIAQAGLGFQGTQAAIIRQSTTNAELDALNIRYGGAVNAAGFKNQAIGERYNAALARSAAKSAKYSGYLNATTAFMQQSANYAQAAAGGGG